MGHFLRYAFLSTRLDANSCLPSNDKKQKDYLVMCLIYYVRKSVSKHLWIKFNISSGFFYNQGRLIEMVKEESRRENNCSDFKIL